MVEPSGRKPDQEGTTGQWFLKRRSYRKQLAGRHIVRVGQLLLNAQNDRGTTSFLCSLIGINEHDWIMITKPKRQISCQLLDDQGPEIRMLRREASNGDQSNRIVAAEFVADADQKRHCHYLRLSSSTCPSPSTNRTCSAI